MTPDQRKDYRELSWLVGEVLLNEWDPIGISDTPEAADEYDSYVPRVISTMQLGGGVEEVAAVLRKIANDSMGLYPSDELHIRAAARCVEAWRASR